jgi:hypothetical protein
MNARLERKLRLLSGIVAAGIIAGIAFTAAMEPSPAPRQRMARKSAAGRRLADARPHRGLWRGRGAPAQKGGKHRARTINWCAVVRSAMGAGMG